MNALYFGNFTRLLYGAYYAAETARARDSAVLICAPIGQEYMRTHRALHQLAGQLARIGFHVLRFDYTGTGDSTGDEGVDELATWREDIAIAARELLELSGAPRVSLVGVRLGGTLACVAAGVLRPSRLVLWDPVVSGAEFVDLLETLHRASLADLDRFRAPRTVITKEDEELLLGFRISQHLRRDLRGLNLLDGQTVGGAKALIVSEESSQYAALRAQLERGGGRLAYHVIPPPGGWDRLDRVEMVLMPYATLQAIVTALQ